MIKDLQCILPKCIVDLLCDFWTNAFDLTGCQITNDSFLGVRNHFLIPFNFELQSVTRMLVPVATEPIAKLLGGGKTVPNRFDLADHFTVCVPHNAAGTVDCDHIVDR